MQIETRKVLWPKKFGDNVVTINAADFDPKIHKDPSEKAEESKARGKESSAKES